MDNLTHTLVGAALSQAGLKRRTALASATLMIGANFPDIDVIAVPLGDSLTWRRGATHGFLALAILPFVLAWLMQWYDRGVRLRRNPAAAPADFRQLLLLSAISISTHPTLDFMNTYGVRLLMPFDGTWFYGDALFIIDPWVWLALGGVLFLRHSRSTLALTQWTVFWLAATWLVWGSTYLAIKYALLSFPPFFQMGTRFLFAGVVLILAGIILNLRIYFQHTSLFELIVMLVLLFGGLGLLARGLLAHR